MGLRVASDGLGPAARVGNWRANGSRRRGPRVASDGAAGRVGWAGGLRRMGPRVASDVPTGRVGWATCGSRWILGQQVASDGPAGRESRPSVGLPDLVGRSCCTVNRAEEGNAARTRREERLDRQGSGKRADAAAEIATWTARSRQRRTWSRAEEGGAEGKG